MMIKHGKKQRCTFVDYIPPTPSVKKLYRGQLVKYKEGKKIRYGFVDHVPPASDYASETGRELKLYAPGDRKRSFHSILLSDVFCTQGKFDSKIGFCKN